jgi:glycerol-3-phosphate dehydrogenase (NAD(P)+)
MNLVVIGAGAWGTALALAASHRAASDANQVRKVTLCAHRAAQAASLRSLRENTTHLPGFALPATLHIGHAEHDGLVEVFGQGPEPPDLVVIATPMHALRATLVQVQALAVGVPVVWLCKGFEAETGLLGHEVQAQVAPGMVAGILSGPSFAQEVAANQPTALVAASPHAGLRKQLVEAFHTASLRVYENEDIVGVEVGGALKNVLAIATGLCDGMQLGLNARAALITRGLAEMTRLGLALGARPETFMGLSGLGDLVLTATGDLSRNRKVGMLLAQGKTLQQAVASLGHVAEGVYSARTALARAQTLGVEMPITAATVALLNGRLGPRDAVAALMGRESRLEW